MLGVCNTPLRSSPQCYRSRAGMLTIICVDTYVSKEGGKNQNTFTVSGAYSLYSLWRLLFCANA